MNVYTTGEIAKLCNVSVRTVQYYDHRNILTPSSISEGGRRLYGEKELEKMKIICFLKDLGFSLDNITKIMQEENAKKVILLLIERQQKELEDKILSCAEKMQKIKSLKKYLKSNDDLSLDRMTGIARIIENKSKMKKIRLIMLIFALPVIALEIISILLWIFKGIWWVFAIYFIVSIFVGVFLSKYSYSRLAYVCPECGKIFKASFKEFFFSMHTPSTRKLKCPSCNIKSYCLETYDNGKELSVD